MNFYVSVIQDTVEYIECNIGESLPLAALSAQAGISEFHFNRMFKTVSGMTLKQYVLGRKLSRASEQIASSDQSVLDIALDLGFEYPEVFSRAFKKQFGVAPSEVRRGNARVREIPKASLVERDIINYRGTLALKGECVFLDEMPLCGVYTRADASSEAFERELRERNGAFLASSATDLGLKQDAFYTVVSCGGRENGEYDVFCGKMPAGEAGLEGFDAFSVPGGWYVDFTYYGDMFDISDVFIDDLYKWIMIKEAEINPNGVGMLNIYRSDYLKDGAVRMLVPIVKPV
ncbi:MAG TPA: AraC family transcriptional regulator [Clostridia bacterium]|jgi:AraC family transcriptional regulator|nr:AraC family transcriptional regulator [Clostridia bacterium]